MAALGIDRAAGFCRIFFFPFRHDVIVGLNFQESLEDQREALGGGLLEREDLDVVIVQAQMSAVAFEVRFAEVVIEEGIVLELCEFDLVRGELSVCFRTRKASCLSRMRTGRKSLT